ncbi:putative replicase-associated protein [Paris virus 2]|nr:putative replicase-associated protein [Paris virus 2]
MSASKSTLVDVMLRLATGPQHLNNFLHIGHIGQAIQKLPLHLYMFRKLSLAWRAILDFLKYATQGPSRVLFMVRVAIAKWIASATHSCPLLGPPLPNGTSNVPPVEDPEDPPIIVSKMGLGFLAIPSLRPKTRTAKILSAVAGTVALGTTIAGLWAVYCRQRDARARRRYISTLLKQRVEDVGTEIRALELAPVRDCLEEQLEKRVRAPEVRDQEGKLLTPEVSEQVVLDYGKAVRNLVCLGKLEFGGVPTRTEANKLAVWRFLFRQCNIRNMNATNTKSCVTAALPLVFLPDPEDMAALMVKHSDQTSELLSAWRECFTRESPLRKLFYNPLDGKAWRQWAIHLFHLDDVEGLEFSK